MILYLCVVYLDLILSVSHFYAATGFHSVSFSSVSFDHTPQFLSQSLPSYCLQPVGAYAKIIHMISKIIAHVLGDSMKKVMLTE